MATGWAWAGSVDEFLATPVEQVAEALATYQQLQPSRGAAQSQVAAWEGEVEIVRSALADCVTRHPLAASWPVILEYELPLEGGRRPDVVVLAGGTIVVMEFKSSAVPAQAAIDQVEAYARDLSEYHEASHGRQIQPVLVLTGARHLAFDFEGAIITGPDELAHYLLESASDESIELDRWLNAAYVPLPTLIAAARRIFANEPLPHIRRAQSEAGIPRALDLIAKLMRDAEETGSRKLILVAGVPGSGKTLVGLRLIYERAETEGRGIFLSGNGPLVDVLQDALQSRAFVRDLHAFIKTYGINGRTPKEQVLVFDEAQRAWDGEYMNLKRQVPKSEPQLLIEAGERIPDWSALVGLVGEGQEIYLGEEAGIGQWREAIAASADPSSWTVHCAPRLADEFLGLQVATHDELDLSISLRSRRAEDLHEWVRHLLQGGLPLAARLATRIQAETYPMYITRDLEEAKAFATARYAEEPDKRFGLLMSSASKLPKSHGLDIGFQTMKYFRAGPWFNAPPEDPRSCCALLQPITEFQCQGLELDLPIVVWGKDFAWTGSDWELTPKRARFERRDPLQLLTNAYRVLLTRGRDGLVVVVPPESELDPTELALLAAGLKPLHLAITEDVVAERQESERGALP